VPETDPVVYATGDFSGAPSNRMVGCPSLDGSEDELVFEGRGASIERAGRKTVRFLEPPGSGPEADDSLNLWTEPTQTWPFDPFLGWNHPVDCRPPGVARPPVFSGGGLRAPSRPVTLVGAVESVAEESDGGRSVPDGVDLGTLSGDRSGQAMVAGPPTPTGGTDVAGGLGSGRSTAWTSMASPPPSSPGNMSSGWVVGSNSSLSRTSWYNHSESPTETLRGGTWVSSPNSKRKGRLCLACDRWFSCGKRSKSSLCFSCRVHLRPGERADNPNTIARIRGKSLELETNAAYPRNRSGLTPCEGWESTVIAQQLAKGNN